MRSALYKFYWAIEQRIAPGLVYSQDHYYAVLKSHCREGYDWLDMGCGHQMFASWMTEEERELAGRARKFVGIDADVPSLRKHRTLREKVAGKLENLPFRSASFDLVTANMVVEHLQDARAALGEIRRLLKPGGLFIFHTPNVRSPNVRLASIAPDGLKKIVVRYLQARREEDVYPTYYSMNTPQAARQLAEEGGFEVVQHDMVRSSASLVMLGPVVVVELLWLRALAAERFKNLRTNMIVVLRKPAAREDVPFR